jgi:hypothetical protein
MKRSTAGLLPLIFPVRRRYQQRARQREFPPPGTVSGEEKREDIK